MSAPLAQPGLNGFDDLQAEIASKLWGTIRNRMLMTVSFVLLTMMQIGIVRVFVPHRLVLMPMRVRFCYQPSWWCW